MKFTQVLFKQNLLRQARSTWLHQGKKKVYNPGVKELVEKEGKTVYDARNHFLKPKKVKYEIDQSLMLHWEYPKDENHPEYKSELCYQFDDTNVLVDGVRQAQVLTNSILADEELPSNLLSLEKSIEVPEELHQQLQNNIQLSRIFDAEQKKLPKRKDPLRPAWVFPRDYGITDIRTNELLGLHLVDLCGKAKVRDLSVVENVPLSFPLKAHDKLLQFSLTAEILYAGKKSLSPPKIPDDVPPLPEIYPLDCTVSIQHHHFYELADIFPLDVQSNWKHAHTALLHFNGTKVKNLFDCEVTNDQAGGRLLMKAFTLAACEARALQEGEVKEPITVQAVQTDGQYFQFSVFRLNTLNLSDSNKRNWFWLSPQIPLYQTCAYVSGIPTFNGYNPLVLQRLMAFLSNR